MSGGIDSSVCAILLKDAGHEIVGVTYRTFDSISESCISKEKGCCSIESIMEAKKFAEKLGIIHHIIDLRAKFQQDIIQKFIDEYLAGRTPNPCVDCNSSVKWGDLIEIANQLNCTHIATGHYARIKFENNRYFLAKGLDETKDQSYFLWKLNQDNLARTIFPLGNYTKQEIRELALQKGFEKLSKKRESQEICFIPDNDYRTFLTENAKEKINAIGPGKFVLTNGKEVGTHKGYPFFTIGQRKGLNVALGEPYYVTHINPATNTITLGKQQDLYSNQIILTEINLMKYPNLPPQGLPVDVKIRYRSTPIPAIAKLEENSIVVDFKTPVSAATPGQSAVLYEGEDVVGGGVIMEAVK